MMSRDLATALWVVVVVPMDAYMAAVRRVRQGMVDGGFASDDEEGDTAGLNLEPSSDEDEDDGQVREPPASRRRTE